MKTKSFTGIIIVLIVLSSLTSFMVLAEQTEDPGNYQQTQNRKLYRNHDEEMPGQHKENDYHHYYGE